MISLLLPLAKRLVGERFAKLASWGAIILLAVAILAIGKCTYDRRLIADHDAKVTQKTLTIDTKAKDKAADQRVTDTLAIDAAQKGRDNEIAKAPAARPDDARNRLNCERLRRAGKDTSGYPACG